jgi:ribosomal protein S25
VEEKQQNSDWSCSLDGRKGYKERFFKKFGGMIMGGGKKKQSLKQMTKPKASKEKKPTERKTSAPPPAKKSLGLTLPDIENKKVLGELKGMKVLTPSGVAARFNLRLSLAKAFLKELERRKMVEYVSGGKNLKIYRLSI